MKKRSPRKKWNRSGSDSLLTCFDGEGVSSSGRSVPYRSGMVPYQVDEQGNISVLLVTPRNGGKWIFPKGNIAEGMDSFRSAVKETREEAGVLGNAGHILLGIVESPKHEFIEFYPLEITQILPEWKESLVRSRLFFPLEEACAALECGEDRAVLDVLQHYVKEQIKSSDGKLTKF